MSEIRFVDRIVELKALKEFCSSFRALPLYVYGPKGCGKTRLLKEFVKRFNNYFGEDAIAIYIDAMERSSLEKALLTPRTIEIAKDVLEKMFCFMNFKKNIESGIGRVLADSISTILEQAILHKKLEGNYVLVIVDDVARAIGLDQVEHYVKWLYELLWKLAEEYRPKAINFIATTSEGKSLELIARHRHAGLSLLWNLDEKAFEELFHELKPPKDIDFEQVWRLLGGNPGKLIELASYYKWNLDNWFKELLDRLKPIAVEIMRRKLTEELKLLIDDPDNVWHKASMKLGELYELLVEKNLFMYRGISALGEAHIPKDLDLGIGKDYAWQVPAYREALRQLLFQKEH
ncbi:MAG: hypothetical protein DRN15_10905 [Thermoprotei archaeon]|nr:MAG: hypothetical protein DRN15_10905 [Thermoprotei archaeon]